MKVFYRKGNVYARAEGLGDIQTLLSLGKAEVVAQVGKKRESVWKYKRSVDCPAAGCGQKFVNLKLHMLKKHGMKPVNNASLT